jgi:hypothetical protein
MESKHVMFTYNKLNGEQETQLDINIGILNSQRPSRILAKKLISDALESCEKTSIYRVL